jgi:hypothetical protein
MDHWLGEAGGVVFDTDRLFGFAEGDAADAVDLAQSGDGEDGLLGGQGAEVIDDVDGCHRGMIAAHGVAAEIGAAPTPPWLREGGAHEGVPILPTLATRGWGAQHRG